MPLLSATVRGVSAFLWPVLLLIAAQFLVPLVALLPPSLAGLKTWGPILALALAGAMAVGFNRGRVVFAVVSLACAFIAYKLFLQRGVTDFPARAVFAALCLITPLNLTVLAVLRERGVFTFYGVRRLGTIVLEVLLMAWMITQQQPEMVEWIYLPLLDSTSVATPIPQFALLIMLVGITVTVVDAIINRSAIDAGFAVSLVAFAIGCNGVETPNHFAVYCGVSALILGIALLKDAYRLAFHDELTGLPSRRALNERLMSLGAHYTIAMLDVDHFKTFNDTHGHELGDQVLRMVAASIERVGGGGRAFRYGGEEFVVLFPGKRLHEAWSHLEAVRLEIAAYRLGIRGPDRPKQPPPERPGAVRHPAVQAVSVTISVGVAERNGRFATPESVLNAADEAMYRAKQKGRNRTSH
jgi:GGDEF domain-containing protein